MKENTIRLKLLFGHLLFALLATSVNPLLPVFQEKFSLGLFQSSILPLSITFFIMIANIVIGFLIAHLGQKRVLVFSLLAALAGVILIYFSRNFAMALPAFCLLGFASGGAFTSLVTIYSGLPDKLLNFGLFHGFFGVGAILAPLLVWLTLRMKFGYQSLFALYGILIIAYLLFIIFSNEIPNSTYADLKLSDKLKALVSPLMLPGLLMLSIYAAIEVGSSTWNANMQTLAYGIDKSLAYFILSGFWIAFTTARFFTDFLSRKFGKTLLTTICILIVFVSLSLWILHLSPYLFIVAGFGLGPIFPIIQKHVNEALAPAQRGLFNGIAFAGTGIATTAFIPVMGAIGESNITLMYSPPLILLILLIILFRISFRKK